MAEVPSTFNLRPGDSAPDFTLPDAAGSVHSLAEVRGPRGLLVVFACNHCPFVVHVADTLGELAGELAREGVHTVAINSNDAEKHPGDAAARMPEFGAAHGWGFPYLVDESQRAAHAYGAACTPDFFLFDAAGRLFYAGQLDETRPRSGKQAHGGDLRAAAQLMLGGGAPPADPRPSSGCNIKWKPGNEPEWWRV